ncbi:MAG: hypothetical protein U9Q15_02850 [Patescibacteria group bacterium]|nr:hypothetical protein [Patescibacteria group bacterium]
MNRYQSSISAYLIVCLLSVVASHEAMASSCQDCQGTNTVTIEGGDLTIEYADKGFMATSRSLILDNLEDKAEVGAANTIGCGQDVIKDVRSGDLGSLYSCMQGLKGSEGPISNVELEDFRQKALNELKNEQINNMDTLESQVQNDVVGIYYNTDPTDSSPFDVIYEMKKIEALIVGPDMVEGLPEHIGIAGNYPATQELYGYMVENGYIGKWAEAIVTPGDITPEDCREFINFQDKEEYLAEQAEDADEKALVAQLYTKLCYGIKTTKSFKGVDDEKVSILDSALNIHSLAIEHGLQPHQISQSALGIWFSAGLSNMMNSFKDTIGGLFGGDGETETTQ